MLNILNPYQVWEIGKLGTSFFDIFSYYGHEKKLDWTVKLNDFTVPFAQYYTTDAGEPYMPCAEDIRESQAQHSILLKLGVVRPFHQREWSNAVKFIAQQCAFPQNLVQAYWRCIGCLNTGVTGYCGRIIVDIETVKCLMRNGVMKKDARISELDSRREERFCFNAKTAFNTSERVNNDSVCAG